MIIAMSALANRMSSSKIGLEMLFSKEPVKTQQKKNTKAIFTSIIAFKYSLVLLASPPNWNMLASE
jgi:hypothetical protein